MLANERTSAPGRQASKGMTRLERKVIFASSIGTIFEWYDFYLYLVLTSVIAKQFFSSVDPNTAIIFTLLGFAAGFIVRPLGAIVFGNLGDMIGRKYTFLLTILIMGCSTFFIGILPNYKMIGIAAPTMLIVLRILQGLAIGGEYGGAAIYTAEHAPRDKRGAYTSWIQMTATLGLFLALIVIQGTRMATGEEMFNAHGWRIPFLVSVFLLMVSLWIRLSMKESPVFAKMKAAGKSSKAPLIESFAKWKNLKLVIFALFGLTAGQAVVWYTGQFYALLFLKQFLKVDDQTANFLVAGALIVGTPFFFVFGSLSDKIGRKKIIMCGCLISALTYFPIFGSLTHYANPALESAQSKYPVVVTADPEKCHFLFNPTDARQFTSSCDIARTALSNAAVSYTSVDGPKDSIASIRIGDKLIQGYDLNNLPKEQVAATDRDFKKQMTDAIKAAGYPTKADPERINYPMVVLLLTILMIYVTMVYGPIAATLVETFPTRIRYTSMSLPYHIGNGWFGGLLPAAAFALSSYRGNIYFGLWYPISVALMTFVVGMFFVKESKDNNIYGVEPD